MRLFLPLFFVAACSTSNNYRDDVGFMVSSQANSPEVDVSINGYLCRDVAGEPGLCAVRVPKGQDLTVALHPREYPYRLHLLCSKEVQFDKSWDVEFQSPFQITIPKDNYSELRSFICIGEIFPKDRADKLSAEFEFRVKLIEGEYVGREAMQILDKKETTYLVLGEYARSSRIWDGEEWKSYTKRTIIEIKDPQEVIAFSESYSMRHNYYIGDNHVQSQTVSKLP